MEMTRTMRLQEKALMSKEGLKRYIDIDVLRILACFFVLVNHTNSIIFLNSEISFIWCLSVLYFICSKVAVPIFLMISGATMFKKEITIKYALNKAMKMCIILFVISLFYYLLNNPISATDFFFQFYQKNISNSLWYLYLYIAILLISPLLSKVCNTLKKMEYIYIIIITVFFIATVNLIFKRFNLPLLSENFTNVLLPMPIIYILSGFFLKNVVQKMDKSKLFIFILLYIASIAIFFVLMFYEKKYNTGYLLFWDNINSFYIYLQSMSLFSIMSLLFAQAGSQKIRKILAFLGQTTFGIYLLNDFVINTFQHDFLKKFSPIFGMFFANVIFGFVIFFGSVLIISIYIFMKRCLIVVLRKQRREI